MHEDRRGDGADEAVNSQRGLLLLGSAMLAVLVGCTSGGHPAGSPTADPSSSSAASPSDPAPSATITIAPGDRAACASVFAHLQQVTAVLQTSAEVIASSLSKEQLSQRIAAEEVQLRQSAELMAQGAVPPPLVAADRRLVAALHALTDDFARAEGPAARGDFKAAAAAMTDEPVVQRIVDASKTIEDACG